MGYSKKAGHSYSCMYQLFSD